MRAGPWKLHFPHPYRTLAGKPGGREGKPAPYSQAQTALVLYDLDKDPGETTDVADKHPDVVQRLSALHERWVRDVKDRS